MPFSTHRDGHNRSPDRWVIGAVGQKLFVRDLPPPGAAYWTARKKADVVAALGGGLLSVNDVLSRYSLTIEELAGWQRAFDRFGMAGLRSTKVQDYRERQGRAQQMGWAAQA